MTALVPSNQRQGPLALFDRETVELIKRNVAKGATDDELKIFLHQAQKTGLDPLAKQIYFRKQKTKTGDQMTIITGIDGYRLVADRTGLYAGNEDPVFDDEERPLKATVTVHKLIGGIRCPFTASARWDQYYPGDAQGFMWRKMPHLMLGKCAEALALRKAFPAELSGLYVREEMDQAGSDVVDTVVVENAPNDEPPTSATIFPGSKAPLTPDARKASIYEGGPAHQEVVKGILAKRGVPEDRWEQVHNMLLGRPSTEMNRIIAEVMEQ